MSIVRRVEGREKRTTRRLHEVVTLGALREAEIAQLVRTLIVVGAAEKEQLLLRIRA